MRKLTFVVSGLFALCAHMTAFAAGWTGLPGKSDSVHYHDPAPLIGIGVVGTGFGISIADETDVLGSCPKSGSVYMDFSEKNAKYFYALALAAKLTQQPVYLEIDCQNTEIGLIAHLVKIQTPK